MAISLTYCKKDKSTPNAEVEAAWSSSAQWGSWTNGGYTLYNNIWGSGAGSQTIWANSYSNWGIWANHPNISGVKPRVFFPGTGNGSLEKKRGPL